MWTDIANILDSCEQHMVWSDEGVSLKESEQSTLTLEEQLPAFKSARIDELANKL